MMLSFILLTWNSQRHIQNCLDSIKAKCSKENIDFEVIAIDNGSEDDTNELLNNHALAESGRLKIINLGYNHGTTYTRNLGLKMAEGDYICIIDSDTYIIDGTLKKILEKLEANDDVGMVVPQLILPDGSIQHSVKKLPAFVHKLLKIPRIVFRMNVPDLDFYRSFPFKEERLVETAISACWFFQKELVDSIGYLDENIFYSPEDMDFCYRIREYGKKILYDPEFKIMHETQQISHKQPFSKVSFSHLSGLIYYYRKHGGWFKVDNDLPISPAREEQAVEVQPFENLSANG